MKCPKCNFENPDDTLYCGKCATPLPSPEEISVPHTETLETPTQELKRGTTFASRYEVIEELGKGGMGKVYRVEDKKIKEEVALKLIKPEIATDKKTIERFSNELKMARKIAHRNVCRMFDLGEEKGTHYITMEYVPGEDLKSFIRRSRQLTVGTAISITKQTCEGLAEAHRIGVIHRDLKPQNIMIDKEGNARIMDFGIARSLKAKGITGARVIIGTPEYMSPEQVEGKEVDQRSDVYSLGVILYEMVTGRVPFEGDTPFTIGVKHKSEEPADPKDLNSQIPEDLSRLILRCLEKEKESRYQSTGEVRAELAMIEKGIPATERIVPRRKPITSKEITVTFGLKKLLIPALAVIAVVIIGVVIWRMLPQKQASIAVLPFADLSPQKDQEYLCDGMTDEIIAKLSRLQGWKVMNMTSVMRYKDTDKDIKEIGRELDVAAILEGRVRKEKDDIRVTAQLVNVKDGFQIWSHTYDQKLKRVFDIQSDIAEKITGALKMELSPEEKERLEKKPTANIEAYNLYLQGRWLWNRRTPDDMQKSINYFERAIEVDPNYALAYAGLADSYLTLHDWDVISSKVSFPNANRAAKKALEIDNLLAEAHCSLAYIKYIYEWDFPNAEREFKRAIELNPSYATAHQWYAEYLTAAGRFEESFKEIDKAQELDPLSLIIRAIKGWILYFYGDYDQSIDQCKQILDMDSNFYPAYTFLGWNYVQKKMYDDAIEVYEKAKTLSGENFQILSSIISAYALSGREEKAEELFDYFMEQSAEKYVSPFTMAMLHTAFKDKDRVFEWLEKAYNERDIPPAFLKYAPWFEDIRSDPRYTALLKKMGLD